MYFKSFLFSSVMALTLVSFAPAHAEIRSKDFCTKGTDFKLLSLRFSKSQILTKMFSDSKAAFGDNLRFKTSGLFPKDTSCYLSVTSSKSTAEIANGSAWKFKKISFSDNDDKMCLKKKYKTGVDLSSDCVPGVGCFPRNRYVQVQDGCVYPQDYKLTFELNEKDQTHNELSIDCKNPNNKVNLAVIQQKLAEFGVDISCNPSEIDREIIGGQSSVAQPESHEIQQGKAEEKTQIAPQSSPEDLSGALE